MNRSYKLRKDRLAAVLLVIMIPILFCCFCSRHSDKSEKTKAADAGEKLTTTATIAMPQIAAVTTTTVLPHISSPSCRAAALYSVDDKRLLYSDNIDEQVAPASLTKLLTASVALKYLSPEDEFTVGTEQSLVHPYSSLAYLEVGSTLTVRELITGMLMSSGNDAAYTLAVSAARAAEPDVEMTDQAAVKRFCKLMNSFAADIGMKNSNFTTPDGWDDYEQHTTVSDLLVLAKYALSQKEIMAVAGTYQKDVELPSGENLTWTNSNLLLDPYGDFYCKEATGLKTGTTLEAGNSLLASFNIGGKTYISAVVGCEEDEDRYELTLKLISEVK
ncbi:MAG: D-alanyl-D-alanine carboxypeptidase [Ruminococcus sp.]|nr:D-alanyl-D-alanine carboxypeptidase [Ruminococcus sp.]